MLLIGLTGSIGMGKSTAANRFRHNGIPVIDADALVHELYAGEAVAPIEAAFPGVAAEGGINREKLSKHLLADPSKFKLLEQIVHPLVQAAERKALHAAKASRATMAVLEIPLLFETGGDKRVDVTVVVSAPPDVQRARVLARPGMTLEKLDAVLKRQMSDADKRKRCDFVVDTSGEIAATEAQIDAIVVQLTGRSGTAFEKYWI
jgi:dephospho-CoA kinase